MPEMSISTVQLDLNSYKVYDASAGADAMQTVQANVYTVDGVTAADGTLRQLSMAELVMVVCLARAAEKEAAVIDLMQKMSENTAILEALTEVEQALVDYFAENPNGTFNLASRTISSGPYAGQTYQQYLVARDIQVGASVNKSAYSDLVTEIESKMDSLNSFSQQKMIELQSETNKRDQSYDLITNVLKSLNTVQVGNSNNI